jgi:hypothetical protein
MLAVDALPLTHLVSVATWGGLVLAETVLEASAKTEDERRHVARTHFWIDMVIELPLLALVVATGAMLAARAWPLSTMHVIKIACGTIAVAANLACVVAVVARHRRRDEPAQVRRWRTRVLLSGTAAPFGVAAAALGLHLAG